jgi:DNA-3-methyladenine glycosylase
LVNIHLLLRDFYERDTLTVAKELLGKYLAHNSTEGTVIGKIVETEAYIGPSDPGSHAYKGLRSKRTEVQFGPGGYAYIYQIYGNYFCFNVVTQRINLANGPAKLCIAMGIDKSLYGVDLCGEKLFIASPNPKADFEIVSTPRINIDYAGEAKSYPWRFVIKNNKFVSRPVME